MNKLIKDKKKVLVARDEYWADLGTHESLKKFFYLVFRVNQFIIFLLLSLSNKFYFFLSV